MTSQKHYNYLFKTIISWILNGAVFCIDDFMQRIISASRKFLWVELVQNDT